MAKISIILPVYNVEKYIEKCIKSILNQTFTDFELIIINDGSKDKSGEICELYASKDKRIKLIHQKNKGLSMARNKGIEESSCDYINFIDSDDYIHKDTIQILYNNLIENQGDISVCDYRLVYEKDEIDYKKQKNNIKILNNIESVNMILEKNSTKMIIAWGKLYKKSLFNNIRYPKGKYHEDEFVTYKLLYNSKRVVLSDAELYYYTQRNESITGKKYSLKRLEKLEGLKEAIDFFEKSNESELELKSRIRYLLNIQIGYYRVKYEMENENRPMVKLKKEYDNEYKKTIKDRRITWNINKFILGFFYFFPDLYSFIVKTFIKISKGDKI